MHAYFSLETFFIYYYVHVGLIQSRHETAGQHKQVSLLNFMVPLMMQYYSIFQDERPGSSIHVKETKRIASFRFVLIFQQEKERSRRKLASFSHRFQCRNGKKIMANFSIMMLSNDSMKRSC